MSKEGKSPDGYVGKARSRVSLSGIVDALPPWAAQNLRSKRSWKTLARCWLASWAAFVIILPEKSLKTLGNASFFVALVSLMVPPNMPVQMFIFAISLIVSGMLLGWGIGAAAMRAAVAARNTTLLQSSYQKVQLSAQGAANPDAVFELDIFQGFFLDIRQIFLDIFCTFGPLFPVTEFTILSSILISSGCYIAIGIVCCIFIFPETMNHSYLAFASVILGNIKGYTQSIGTVLDMSPEQITADEDGCVSRCVAQRREMLSNVQALQQKGGLINVEFSWGRWNGDDARGLEDPLRVLVARLSEFYSFTRHFRDHTLSLSKPSTRHVEDDSAASSISVPENMVVDTELIRQLKYHRLNLEAEHGVRMEDIIVPLRESTAELRAACIDALGVAQTMITDTNDRRWKGSSNVIAADEAALDTAAERLRKCLEEYKADKRFAIIQPYLPLLHEADKSSRSEKNLPIRSLLVASSFAAQLLVSVDAALDLLEVIRRTVHKRKKSRLWAPSGLRAIGNYLLRREKGSETEAALGESTLPESDDDEKAEEVPYRRDPDSRPPKNAFQKLMNGVHGIYKWIQSAEAKFAIKYFIITILLWLPSVFISSAHFYYVYKGVWALIMAQTTLNLFASDQIYSMAMRFIGTFCGSGHGNGNPYGVAAAIAVFLVPIVFVRIYAPPILLQGVIMFNATLALVIGYSWIDAHLVVVGNPGIGWSVAWKRFVLVMIGFAAASFMMMFPPASGRKSVRLRNAALISELSGLYSTLMSVWISEEETQAIGNTKEHSDGDKEAAQIATMSSGTTRTGGWPMQLRKKVLSLAEQMQIVRGQTGMAKFEGSIRGVWPGEEYNLLLDNEADMLAAFAQLCSALQHLDPAWRISLNRRTMILNPNFITDVISTFALVSHSLRTAEPMHQILPTSLLDRLLYHHDHDTLAHADNEEEKTCYVERISSLDFMYFSTGVAAVSQAIQSLDEMHRITRRLCGEIPFKGFTEWKNDYEHVYGRA
ncbi:hypothetical protein EW145_g3442 [Phellinidium pouzarii]|uniref:ER transporter 6TM N-terminal domain-containing protein n=1 Tax=Phellinidium pouzarii TaxID=167371 RepID=A0A4S4L923_9AGAM|nr:hypothetical protein EW145_g3442 [Phellinidium pouzarii]